MSLDTNIGLIEAYAKAKGYKVVFSFGDWYIAPKGFSPYEIRLLTPAFSSEHLGIIHSSDNVHADVPMHYVVFQSGEDTAEAAYDECLSKILKYENMSNAEEMKIWLDLMNKA